MAEKMERKSETHCERCGGAIDIDAAYWIVAKTVERYRLAPHCQPCYAKVLVDERRSHVRCEACGAAVPVGHTRRCYNCLRDVCPDCGGEHHARCALPRAWRGEEELEIEIWA